MTTRAAIAAVLLIVLAGCNPNPLVTPAPQPTQGPGPTVSPSQAPEPGTSRSLPELISATVQVAAYSRSGAGTLTRLGTGSGTILTADGLILTNAHVAGGDTPGLAVQYGDIDVGDHVDVLRILVNEGEDRPPVERYTASVAAIDGYIDLAVLKIDGTVDGQPVTSLDLPFVPLGDSDDVHIGDSLTIVGYPGIGGQTVSVDSDEVAGFLDDPKLGPRGWIKHAALQSGGNSGGLLADGQGRIIGVPTKSLKELSAYGNARPINWGKPLIEAAETGTPYTPFALVQTTGNEKFELLGWSTDTENCDAADRVTSYTTGAKQLVASISWNAIPSGVDMIRLWVRDLRSDEPTLISKRSLAWELNGSTSCGSFSVSDAGGFPDGVYTVLVFLGPSLSQVFRADVSVGGSQEPGPGPDDGRELSGRILDAATGLGIPGATATVLKPGSDAATFLQDPLAGASLVVAVGRTNEDGQYTFDRLLSNGVYPWVLRADGYRSGYGELTISGTATLISDVSLARVATP